MQLHELQPKTTRKLAKRIGRGGKRGKTSGKGHKGQKARAGNSTRPEMRDFIKRFPKLRGHGKNRARTVNSERVRPLPLNLSALEASFENGSLISPKTLAGKKLVPNPPKGIPKVKILGTGELTKKFTIRGCEISKTAQAKIEKAGGSVVA